MTHIPPPPTTRPALEPASSVDVIADIDHMRRPGIPTFDPKTLPALDANAAPRWNEIWAREGETWRGRVLSSVYSRISSFIPRGARVVDLGGGTGVLGQFLAEQNGADVLVVDHSDTALEVAREGGCRTEVFDLERGKLPEDMLEGADVVVSTEVLEHLQPYARHDLLRCIAATGKPAFFSVPNDRLGPDEEPQHTTSWTAKAFRTLLEGYFGHVRVEAHGPLALGKDGSARPAFLLARCNGEISLEEVSMTMPVRDEEEDVERVLASFVGHVDRIVVGVDPRSKDRTREICEKYADIVFTLDSPQGKGDDKVAEAGVHFSHIRNQCIDMCSTPWIFMTEGHEHLHEGHDVLRNLNQLTAVQANIALVLRTSGTPLARSQWAFPWLFRKDPKIRFSRATHNTLEYPDSYLTAMLPQVKTLHSRSHERDLVRQKQRRVQNRVSLMEDWLANENPVSLFYLAAEWREYDTGRSIERLEQFIAHPRGGGIMKYHARLVLAKLLCTEKRYAEAKDVLLGATACDYTRTEHWVHLGDIFFEIDADYERALIYYRYAATRINDAPVTLWWIELSYYSWLPAQRLAMCYGALGKPAEALAWARNVKQCYPEGTPEPLLREADENIRILEEATDASK